MKTKEQQECPYCHGPKEALFEMSDYDGITEFGVFDIKVNGVLKAKMKHNYCPMCGRKLVHDEN